MKVLPRPSTQARGLRVTLDYLTVTTKNKIPPNTQAKASLTQALEWLQANNRSLKASVAKHEARGIDNCFSQIIYRPKSNFSPVCTPAIIAIPPLSLRCSFRKKHGCTEINLVHEECRPNIRNWNVPSLTARPQPPQRSPQLQASLTGIWILFLYLWARFRLMPTKMLRIGYR